MTPFVLSVSGKTPEMVLGSSMIPPSASPHRLYSRQKGCFESSSWIKIPTPDRLFLVRAPFAPEFIVVTLLFRKAFCSKDAIVHVVLATPCGIKSEHMEPGGLSKECRSIQREALLRGRTARKNQSQEKKGWPHIASVVAANQAIAEQASPDEEMTASFMFAMIVLMFASGSGFETICSTTDAIYVS